MPGKMPSISQLKLATTKPLHQGQPEASIVLNLGSRGTWGQGVSGEASDLSLSQGLDQASPPALRVPGKEEPARGQRDRQGGKGPGFPRSAMRVADSLWFPIGDILPSPVTLIAPRAKLGGSGRKCRKQVGK